MTDRPVSNLKAFWDSMSQDSDVREGAQRRREEIRAAEDNRLAQRKPAPWPVRIIVGGVLIFGFCQLASLPAKAISDAVEWWDPYVYISPETLAVLSEEEVAIFKMMPEDLRFRVGQRDPDRRADFVMAWQDARTQTCHHGSTKVASGDYRGFTECKSKGQADLEKWAFEQVFRRD